MEAKGLPQLLAEFFLVPFRLRTYGSLLYIWLAFPLGLAYFVVFTVGTTVGIATTIVWVGFFLLFLTALLALGVGRLEGALASLLLGAELDERPAPESAEHRRFRDWFFDTFSGAEFWKGCVFLMVKFPLALAGWMFSVVSLASSLAFFLAPLVVLLGVTNVRIDDELLLPATTAGLVFMSIAGGFGFLVTLHLHNALGWIWSRLAELLLTSPAARTDAPAKATSDLPAGATPAIA